MWSLRSPWPDPCSWSPDEALTRSLRCHRCRLDALGSRRSPDPGRLHVISSSKPIILNEASRGEHARQDNDLMFIGRCSRGRGAFGRSMHRQSIRNEWSPLAATWSTGYWRCAYVAGGPVRPVVCRRRVGALGWPSSSRRRNIEQSPQYGPHLLTVRKPRRRDHARLGRRSDANGRQGWRNRVPAETGFCFGRCYAALSLGARPKMAPPQLSRLFRHARGHAVEDTASLTGRKFVAEKY